jgi:hypothetical protein
MLCPGEGRITTAALCKLINNCLFALKKASIHVLNMLQYVGAKRSFRMFM